MDITILSAPIFSELANLAFALRKQVLVVEQNVPTDEEFDADDLAASHMVAIVRGDVAGKCSAFAMPSIPIISRPSAMSCASSCR